MRLLPRVFSMLLAGAVLLGPASGPAFATTVEDLIKLKNNKVSDDVLIALIESDGSVFYLNADDIVALKQKGLSEKVILVMLATAAKHQARVAPATPPTPAQVVNDQYQPMAVEPPTPVMLTVTQTQTVEQPSQPYYATPYYAYPSYSYAYPVNYRPIAAQPVYWGFNGQRNPNAWGPTVQEQALKPVFVPHGGVPANQQSLIPQTPSPRGGRR
jgi:hypothetical protein